MIGAFVCAVLGSSAIGIATVAPADGNRIFFAGIGVFLLWLATMLGAERRP